MTPTSGSTEQKTKISMPSGNDFELVGSKISYQGRVVNVHEETYRDELGDEFMREVIHHMGAVSVVPLLSASQVLLVRQWRAPLQETILEIPAGKLDVSGEAPIHAANRELREETGYYALSMHHLAAYHSSVGFTDEYSRVYIGFGLVFEGTERHGPEEEAIEEVVVNLSEVPLMIQDGEITDGKTIIGLMMAREWLSHYEGTIPDVSQEFEARQGSS